MEKIIGLIILIVGAGIFLYLLPFLGPLFNVDLGNFADTSGSAPANQVIFLNNSNGDSEPAVWHSSLKPDIFEIQNYSFSSSILYATTNRGLFISRDSGKNWYPWFDLEKKIEGALIYKIAFDKNVNGRAFVAVYKNNRAYVYETNDNIFSLNQVFDSASEAVYSMALVNGNLLMGLSDGRILSYLPQTKEFRPFANFSSAVDNIKPANSHLYVTTESNGVFVRLGGSDKFEPLANGTISGEVLKSIAVEEKTGSPLYAASLAGAFSSFNQGYSWNGIQTVLASRDIIDSIFLSPQKELYLASGAKLYRSRDSGKSWQAYFSLDEKLKRKISSVYFGESGRIVIGTKS